jgi:hypothetical protein
MHIEFWWGNPRGRDRSENLSIDGRIILKSIFKNIMCVCGGVAGCCENSNEPSGSIKYEKFLD